MIIALFGVNVGRVICSFKKQHLVFFAGPAYIYIYIYIYKYMQYTNDTHNRGLTFDYTTYTVMEGAWHKATPRIFAGPSDIYVYNIQTTPATEISLSIIQRTQ